MNDQLPVRLLLLTSTSLRHHAFVQIAADTPDVSVAGVWQEVKSFDPYKGVAPDSKDDRVIRDHFARRDEAEDRRWRAFARLRLPISVVHREIGPGAINAPEEVASMRDVHPDAVLVFGTGLLRAALIEAFAGRIINLHLGLSPYYRGSGTNFWPLVNGQPEYVGATIHYLDEGIDTGPIIAHARPSIAEGDGPHDIGNNAIERGVEMLLRAGLAHVRRGSLPGRPQTARGRLYQRKDFGADAVRRLYGNFEAGMVARYLRARGARDAALDLVALAG